MKNRVLLLLLSLLLIGVVVIFCLAFRSRESTQTGTRHQVTLVAKSTETEFWKSVFAGARTAANEYNLDLTICGPKTEEDYEMQNRMLEQAVSEGAEAVVFSAIAFEKNVSAVETAAAAGVQIVSIDSRVNTGSVSTYIGTDNFAAGQMAGQGARIFQDEQQETMQVGLVNFNAVSANGQEREQGIREDLEAHGISLSAVVYTDSLADTARADTVALLQAHPEINVLISCNEPVTVGAARAVAELGLEDRVWLVGFDSNVESVDMLQSGVVDALVVQNPYAMGYLGVETAWQRITGQQTAPAEEIRTDTILVTRENMFSPPCQKLLFPFDAGEDGTS